MEKVFADMWWRCGKVLTDIGGSVEKVLLTWVDLWKMCLLIWGASGIGVR